MKKYLIQDEFHCERQWEYNSFNEALLEIERISKLPYDIEPNICPCTSWKTCGRDYIIIEYENGVEIKRSEILEIWADWIKWLYKK